FWLRFLHFLLLIVAWLAIASCTTGQNNLVFAPNEISLEKNSVTSVVFLSPSCPCSISHEPILRELSQTYPEIRFLAVYSGPEIDAAKAHFEGKLPFPIVYDP